MAKRTGCLIRGYHSLDTAVFLWQLYDQRDDEKGLPMDVDMTADEVKGNIK